MNVLKAVEHIREWLHRRSQRNVQGELGGLRWRTRLLRPGSEVRCHEYSLRINDGPNYCMLYKDLFVHRIYHCAVEHEEERAAIARAGQARTLREHTYYHRMQEFTALLAKYM